MKVLFIGEGPHELGHGDFQFSEPRQAGGILPALACKMCEWITEPVALRWTDLARFNPNVKRSGLAAKVAAAVLLSARRFECQGTVCVCDRDRDDSRLPAMEEGRNRGLAAIGDDDFPVACGVAVESIEAWTLGATSALAATLGLEPETLHAEYAVSRVEGLYENSGKPENQPKPLLERIAQLGNRTDSANFRRDVAERTDIGELERNCPMGFKPFVDTLRKNFGAVT